MIFRKLKQESIFCWTMNNINYIILFFVTRWNAFKRLFCSPIFYGRPYLLKRQFRKKKDETKKTEKSRNLSNTPGKCWVIMSLFVGHFAQFLQHKLLPVNLCLFSTEVELHFFFLCYLYCCFISVTSFENFCLGNQWGTLGRIPNDIKRVAVEIVITNIESK